MICQVITISSQQINSIQRKSARRWIEMIPRHLPVFWSASDTHAHILLLNYLIDTLFSVQFSSVPSLSRARLFGTP